MARKKDAFEAGKGQAFCILTPETPQAFPQLWTYTAFPTRHEAEMHLARKQSVLGRSVEGFTIGPCEVSLRLSHF